MSQNVLFPINTRMRIIPRDYQDETVSESFRQWDGGQVGVLHRMFTGAGKTITAAMCFEQWLDRDPQRNRCMVISYEKQLVWQFAQEVKDVLGISPGIEMERESIDEYSVPQVVVASRQTLLRRPPATEEQQDQLRDLGVIRTEAITRTAAKKILSLIDAGYDSEWAQEEIDIFNEDYRSNRDLGSYSRLYKFDPSYNWLLCFDEAHRQAHILNSVGHLVDWFDKNPNSRRFGMTATPKRADNISLGSKMFRGIAMDYPMLSLDGRCAVRDGWAVPYVQRFIQVESIDFKNPALRKPGQPNGDFDEAALQVHLNNERELARLVEPLLDLVGERRTLIFSPGVDMARNVASYINARVKVECPQCNKIKWVAELGVEDARCECGSAYSPSNIISRGQSKALWGAVPPEDRREVYHGHQSGRFQFLSVCGLCREGYNDPDIACVAIFRPVSKSASSLAEQMKGRGSRPLRGLVDGLSTAEERVAAIKASAKPDVLIIDLTGVTGLADCATTASIYAEGMDDDVVSLAEEIVYERGGGDVEGAVREAQEEVTRRKEEAKRERERKIQEAERLAKQRALGGATARYSVHERGVSGYRGSLSHVASEKQVGYIRVLGLDLEDTPITKNQASRIIGQLKSGIDIEEVKRTNRLPAELGPSMATKKQKGFLKWKRIPYHAGLTFAEASRMIDAAKDGR